MCLSGGYACLGGFWAEEALWWDAQLRNDERFRIYLSAKYPQDELVKFGIKDIRTVKCPPPSEEGRGRAGKFERHSQPTQKFIFAEYMEYLADTGVEIWRETVEWLTGLRMGTYLMFSLSQRYVNGGSTYISAYPRIGEFIGSSGP